MGTLIIEIHYAAVSIYRNLLKTQMISSNSSAYVPSPKIQNLSAKRKFVDDADIRSSMKDFIFWLHLKVCNHEEQERSTEKVHCQRTKQKHRVVFIIFVVNVCTVSASVKVEYKWVLKRSKVAYFSFFHIESLQRWASQVKKWLESFFFNSWLDLTWLEKPRDLTGLDLRVFFRWLDLTLTWPFKLVSSQVKKIDMFFAIYASDSCLN